MTGNARRRRPTLPLTIAGAVLVVGGAVTLAILAAAVRAESLASASRLSGGNTISSEIDLRFAGDPLIHDGRLWTSVTGLIVVGALLLVTALVLRLTRTTSGRVA
jgi:hypothetical protein